MSSSATPSKILEDLIQSGFPSEVRVASILAKKDWMIYPGALFKDADSDKPREIDIHAVYVDRSLADRLAANSDGNENKLISHLIIEVKKSDKPWVFFNNAQRDWPGIPANTFKSDKEDFHYSFSIYEKPQDFPVKSHRYLNAEFHKGFHVSFNDPSKNSPIYESFVKTKKAFKYFMNQYGASGYALHIFIPVVVIDGTLWSANLKQDGSVTVKQVPNLLASYGFLEKHLDENETFEEEQIFEVVALEHLENYLMLIEKDNKGIYEAWTKYNIEYSDD